VVRTSERGATRKRIVAGGATLVLVAGIAAGLLALSRPWHHGAPTAPTARVATTTVVRTDLAATQTFPGALGYGAQIPVVGRGAGIVTSLPPPGRIVARGQALYRVDDQPVVVFYGDTPLFRTLRPADQQPPQTPSPPPSPPPASPPAVPGAPGVTTSPPPDSGTGGTGASAELHGRDVTVVARNLAALGYDIGPQPGGAADAYTPQLAAAVRHWQQSVGMTPTGKLRVGQIVVLPGPVRVAAVQALTGDSVAEPLLSVTGTAKVVTVPVQATGLTGIVRRARASISLPDGRRIPGRVTAVSQAAQSPSGDDNPDDPASTPTVDVRVRLLSSAGVAHLDSAPVQVRFVTSTRRGVLAVPVGALLALSGGGYALQRPDGALIAVRTGLFAGGMVEVSGSGLTAGLHVDTAS
jgi:hypothetical protein